MSVKICSSGEDEECEEEEEEEGILPSVYLDGAEFTIRWRVFFYHFEILVV